MSFACEDILIIINSDYFCIETATISAFYFIVLIAFIAKVMLAWFGDKENMYWNETDRT